MKTIVTGGTGFIGTHLINRLIENGSEVTCLAKDEANSDRLKKAGVELVLCDLRQPREYESYLRGAEIIFHLAGTTRAKRTRDYYEGNYEATKQFVNCCSHLTTLRRFVYASSLTATGPRINGEEVTEATECHPVSHYGRSKMMAELEVMRAAAMLPVTVVRPAAVYGPGDRDLYQYYKAIKMNIEPIFGRKRKYLNMIYVSDLVEGFCLAASHAGGEGEVFILGGENHSTEEICDMIAFAEGKRPMKIKLPECLGYAAGAAAGVIGKLTGSATFFNVQKAREAAQTSWTCSIEKAKRVLGFHPRVSLQEGISLAYEWYVRNGWLPE